MSKLKESLEREFVLFFNDSAGYHPDSVEASPSASTTPTARRGVSLAWLRSLAACLEDEEALHEDSSTRHVVSKILMPYVKKSYGHNGHLWQALPVSQVGPPSFFVIHSWGGDFVDLVSQLSEQLAPKDIKHKAQPWVTSSSTTQPSYASIYVWLDFLSITHQAANMSALNPGEPSQFDVDLLRDSVLSCSKGAVFVIDPQLATLSRAWCLMEVFQACYVLEPGKLQIAFPWSSGNELMPFDFPAKFIAAVSNIDIIRADCFRPDDKAKIVFQAKQGLGVKRTQDILKEGLVRATRSSLRWGTLSHFFYYCAHLIQGGEVSLLFTILAHIPEIQEEDSSSLDEIKDIFNTFDETGLGRLLEDAFIRVLGCAGFTIREAVEVFEAISGQDGKEGVGIDEFTSWWAGSQKEKIESGKTTPKITGEGFCKMMEGLCVFLERKKMIPHAAHLRGEVAKLQAQGSHSHAPLGPRMPPPPFRGEWEKFVSKLSWMLHNEDIKGASKHIYEFLVDNQDSVHCKIQEVPLPPSFVHKISPSSQSGSAIGGSSSTSLAAPSSGSFSQQNSAGWGRRIMRGSKLQRQKDLQLTMKSYLELLVDILRWHPEHGSLMNHLSRTAQEFLDLAAMTSRSIDSQLDNETEEDSDHEEDDEESEGGRTSSRRRSKSGRQRSKSSSRQLGEGKSKKEGSKAYKNWYSFGLITDMVKLKYNDGAVNQDRIKEAGSVLSQWMAGRRGGGKQPLGKDKESETSSHRLQGAVSQSRVAMSNLKESYMAGRIASETALPSLSDLSGNGGDNGNDRWNNLKSMPTLTNTPRSTGGSVKSHFAMGGGGNVGLSPRSIVMGGGGGGGGGHCVEKRPLVPELPLGTSLAQPQRQRLTFEDSESTPTILQSPRSTSLSLGSRLTMSRLVLPVTPRGGSSMYSDEADEGLSPRKSTGQRSHPAVPPLQLSSLKSSKTTLPSIQSNQGPSSAPEEAMGSSRSTHQVGFGDIYSQDEDHPAAAASDSPNSSRLPAPRTKSSLSNGLGVKIKAKVSISGVDLGGGLGGTQSQGGSPREKGFSDIIKRKQLLSQLSTIMQMQIAKDEGKAVE